MRFIAYIFFCLLALKQCSSRSLPEDDSVVSVYAKDSTSRNGTKTSVAYLIASGLASRIASPFTNLLNFGKNVTATTTKRPFHRIELLEDMEQYNSDALFVPLKDEPKERDVEELSKDSIYKKTDKKPEKIVLFSNFMPIKEKLELNSSLNEVDVDNEFDFDIDDGDDFDEVMRSRQGGFIYILEVLGSVLQLLWGGLLALFQPSSS